MRKLHSVVMVSVLWVGLVVAQGVGAATYFVDPVNGNDSNLGTSTSAAVKTISQAGLLAGPGDTVNLMSTGHYPWSRFDAANWSGTSTAVITVQSYPGNPGGAMAVFDPGYPEFKSNPNTAWVRCTEPGAHPDEYISTGTYPAAADGRAPAYGTFLSSGDRLINYDRVDDFRSNNESFVAVPLSDPRLGLPIWNKTSNKLGVDPPLRLESIG